MVKEMRKILACDYKTLMKFINNLKAKDAKNILFKILFQYSYIGSGHWTNKYTKEDFLNDLDKIIQEEVEQPILKEAAKVDIF